MKLEKISTGQHKARYLHINGERVRIDTNIYHIIDGLNRLGIVTGTSCGGDCMGWCRRKHRRTNKRFYYTNRRTKKREWCYRYHTPKQCSESFTISFQDPGHAARFMNIVYREADPEKFRDHIQGQGRKQSHAWTWKHWLDDFNDPRCIDHRGYLVGKRVGPPFFNFRSIVVIPHAHLKLVERRVFEACCIKDVFK